MNVDTVGTNGGFTQTQPPAASFTGSQGVAGLPSGTPLFHFSPVTYTHLRLLLLQRRTGLTISLESQLGSSFLVRWNETCGLHAQPESEG